MLSGVAVIVFCNHQNNPEAIAACMMSQRMPELCRANFVNSCLFFLEVWITAPRSIDSESLKILHVSTHNPQSSIFSHILQQSPTFIMFATSSIDFDIHGSMIQSVSQTRYIVLSNVGCGFYSSYCFLVSFKSSIVKTNRIVW